MNYIKIGLIGAVLVIVVLLIIDYTTSKAELQAKKAELLLLSHTIQEQNTAIKKLEIDVETYKNKKPQIVEKIVEKYKTTEVKDETCEAYMVAIYQDQLKFFDSLTTNKTITMSQYYFLQGLQQ